MNFFEKNYHFWRLTVPFRLLASAALILVAKLVGSLIVYHILNVPSTGSFWVGNLIVNGIQNQVLQQVDSPWCSLYLGWDSAWYLSILTYGYTFSAQSLAFFPGFPLVSSFLDLGIQNAAASLAFCSLFFGVLYVPVYQLVAELYLSKPVAFLSTLLFALFPFVFLFTTVAYSESILLFFVLLSWLLFKKGKTAYASLSAAVAAISRAVGIVIIIPMAIEILTGKSLHKKRDLALCFLPAAAFLAWLVYGQIVANDWLAFIHTTDWKDMYSFREFIFQVLPQNGLQGFTDLSSHNPFLPLAACAYIIVPSFLIAELRKTSKSLTAYSLVYFLGVLTFGAMMSLPRFMSILFPLWIALMSRFVVNKPSVILLCGVFVVFFVWSVYLWMKFLSGVFVG
ncbi:MAG: hypothetical protein ACFCUE_02410 [Candidatus Bathyarchaeia archaeon]|jgi:Gpi18-like mannosyltransferase